MFFEKGKDRDDGPRGLKCKFTKEEDNKLRKLVAKYGTRDWKVIASRMKGRTNRQCRERYKYYLHPSIRTDDWSAEEDKLLLRKVSELGTKWSKIARFFSARTDVSLKNRYKKLVRSVSSQYDDNQEASEDDYGIQSDHPFQGPKFRRSTLYW